MTDSICKFIQQQPKEIGQLILEYCTGHVFTSYKELYQAVILYGYLPEECERIYGIIELWNVSNITNMQKLFYQQTKFNGNISRWDVSNVTDMSYMFCMATKFNQDISKWNVSKVTDMNYMFIGATKFNQDISGWDVSNVKDIDSKHFRIKAFKKDIFEQKLKK